MSVKGRNTGTVEFVDATRKSPPLGTESQAVLNLIPAHASYAAPSGALTFLNVRGSDYLGLPKDHHLRSGIDTGAMWTLKGARSEEKALGPNLALNFLLNG